MAAAPVSCSPVASNTCRRGADERDPVAADELGGLGRQRLGTSQTSSIEIGSSSPVMPSAEAVMVVVIA